MKRPYSLAGSAALLVAGLSLTSPPSLESAESWAAWRGPNGDGISPEVVPSSGQWPDGGLKTLWKTNVGTGFSSPVVADGKLIVTGNQDDRDTVYCLDVASGKTLWKHAYDSEIWPYLYDGGPNATATIDGERLSHWGVMGPCGVWSWPRAKVFGRWICTRIWVWPSLRGVLPALLWWPVIGWF